MEEQREDTSFDSLKESADLKVCFGDEKVTLYISDSCVLGVEFHDPSQWHHRTSWKCVPDPDKSYLHLHNMRLSKQLRALKEKVDTGHRHLMTMNGPLVFVFGHDTDDDARRMVADNPDIKKTFLIFLQEIDKQVKDIKMQTVVGMASKDVTREADVQSTTVDTGHRHLMTMNGPLVFVFEHDTDDDARQMVADNPDIKKTFLLFLQEIDKQVKDIKMQTDVGMAPKDVSQKTGLDSVIGMAGSAKAVKSNVAGTQNAKEINQGDINIHGDVYVINDVEGKIETEWHVGCMPFKQTMNMISTACLRFARSIRDTFGAKLKRLVSGSLIFYFVHSTREDAIDMIIRHMEVKTVILQFLRDLDSDIEDIRIKVELRELGEPQEHTAQHSSVRELPIETKVRERPMRTVAVDAKGRKVCGGTKEMEPPWIPYRRKVRGGTKEMEPPWIPYRRKVSGGTKEMEPPRMICEMEPPWIPYLAALGRKVSGGTKVAALGRKVSGGTKVLGEAEEELVEAIAHISLDSDKKDERGAPMARSLQKSDPQVTTTPAHYKNPRAVRDLCKPTWMGDLEAVKELLTEGRADVNCRGFWGLTPVMWAAWRGHSELIEFLVSRGADMSLVTDSGNTVLHLACEGGNLETVEFLLSKKIVDINARNKYGMTAAEMASGRGHQKVKDLLKSCADMEK